jgi:hypothetical protein
VAGKKYLDLSEFIDIPNHTSYIVSNMKPLEFVGSSLDDLKEFPAEAGRAAGFELGLFSVAWRHLIGSP